MGPVFNTAQTTLAPASSGAMTVSVGNTLVNQLYGGGGLEGGLGCGEDDEIFLLPLTALAMEADDLRWISSFKKLFSISQLFDCQARPQPGGERPFLVSCIGEDFLAK